MTTDVPLPAPGREIQTLDTLSPDQAAGVLDLLAEAARTDGRQAVSEQGRLQLRGGSG
ncbi:mycothiol synthase, partial [Streptomyces sp. col6]